MDHAVKTIVTKGDYAVMKGRARSAISNWIADGKISRDALVGDGVRAKIWVERADADLNRNLDPSQQVAQDRPVGSSSDPGMPPAPEDDDIRRRRKADADRAEQEAALSRLKTEREAKRWIDAAEARQAWGRELSELMINIETFVVSVLPRVVADEFGLTPGQVAAITRKAWHARRSQEADAAAQRAAEADGRQED